MRIRDWSSDVCSSDLGTRNAPLKRLRAHGESARAEVLARAKQQLAAGHSPEAVLDFLAHTLTNRLLHAPTVALREAAIRGDTDLLHAVDRLMHGADADQDDDADDPAPQARGPGRKIRSASCGDRVGQYTDI